MLKEKKKDSNYCIQHPIAQVTQALRSLASHTCCSLPLVHTVSLSGLISQTYMIDPGENAEVSSRPASKVGEAGRWERGIGLSLVYSGRQGVNLQRCEKKFRAGGQTGLQCSATIVDHNYERLCLLGTLANRFCFLLAACSSAPGLNVIPETSRVAV